MRLYIYLFLNQIKIIKNKLNYNNVHEDLAFMEEQKTNELDKQLNKIHFQTIVY